MGFAAATVAAFVLTMASIPIGAVFRLFDGQEAYFFIGAGFILTMISGYFTEMYIRRDFLKPLLLDAEREKSESLLLNILPKLIADRLKEETKTIADGFAEVTVLFADLVDFTKASAALSPGEVVTMLNEVFSEFDDLGERYGLEKIKTIGDAYMVVGGLPTPRPDHAESVAEMAPDMMTTLRDLNRRRSFELSVRIGI